MGVGDDLNFDLVTDDIRECSFSYLIMEVRLMMLSLDIIILY